MSSSGQRPTDLFLAHHAHDDEQGPHSSQRERVAGQRHILEVVTQPLLSTRGMQRVAITSPTEMTCPMLGINIKEVIEHSIRILTSGIQAGDGADHKGGEAPEEH